MKNFRKMIAPALCAALGVAVVAGSIAVADPAKEKPAAGAAGAAPSGAPAEMQLPPGWTPQDMQAMVAAGTPGKMHEHLATGVGTWQGKTSTWMIGSDQPMSGQCTMTVAPMMDGRYIRTEVAGEMPGMGPYNGFGISGFDNVTGQFVSTWIDNHSTGIMNGTGELAQDGKTINWTFTHSCPITKKPAVMRQVETITGDNTRTLEMFGADPKSGKEFKMMRIEFAKKS